jgi:hypothetical protein
MSAKASKAAAQAGGGDPSGAAAALAGLEPMVESETDEHETLIEYNPTSKMPLAVILVWICALVGLGTYMVTLYLPDLALWYK